VSKRLSITCGGKISTHSFKIFLFVCLALTLLSCSSAVRFASGSENIDYNNLTSIGRGFCSYYADKFQGKQCASGEIYDKEKMTAAHNSLPFGSLVLVKNLENGKKTVVRINDRGPFVKDRVIDLSYTAAKQLDMIDKGVVEVEIYLIEE